MKDGIARAVVRGTLAGVVGVLAMDLYSRASARLRERFGPDDDGEIDGDAHDEGTHDEPDEGALDDVALVGPFAREDEPATVTVGRLAYESVKGDEPSRDQGGTLGKAVHWTYGLAVGGLFGLLRDRVAAGSLTAGLGYGAALWLLGDEIAVPVLGLAAGPTAHAATVHADALGAHLVYGLATSATAKALRPVL